MINVNLRDLKYRNTAHVDSRGALSVSTMPSIPPAPGSGNQQQLFIARLGSTGFDSGTLSMDVNGATTPQVFFGAAALDFDIHIMHALLLIVGNGVQHNQFGSLAALINGVDLSITEAGTKTNIFTAAKTSGDLLTQIGGINYFGSGNTTNIINNFSGTSDGVFVPLPLAQFIPNGLRLGRLTLDKLEFTVRDDLTALTSLFLYCYGYRNYPQTED